MEGLYWSVSSLHLKQQKFVHNYPKSVLIVYSFYVASKAIFMHLSPYVYSHGFFNFCNLQCFFVILLLLLQAGDIETNQGPENVHDLSILHLNTRSIRNKLDFILDNFSDFNILCFTETHLDANVSTDMLSLSNCYSTLHRKDRTNHGGGVMAYINLSLLHVKRSFAKNQYG